MVSSYHQYNTCLIIFISIHTSQHKMWTTQNVTALICVLILLVPNLQKWHYVTRLSTK